MLVGTDRIDQQTFITQSLTIGDLIYMKLSLEKQDIFQSPGHLPEAPPLRAPP